MVDELSKGPGFDSAMTGYSAATKSMQDFASEFQRMSKESIESTSQLMEKLRGAKTMEEMMSIQTSFMQHSFSSYANYTRRLSEMMMAMTMDFAKQSRSAVQQGTDAFSKATEQAGHQAQQVGEEINKHHG